MCIVHKFLFSPGEGRIIQPCRRSFLQRPSSWDPPPQASAPWWCRETSQIHWCYGQRRSYGGGQVWSPTALYYLGVLQSSISVKKCAFHISTMKICTRHFSPSVLVIFTGSVFLWSFGSNAWGKAEGPCWKNSTQKNIFPDNWGGGSLICPQGKSFSVCTQKANRN